METINLITMTGPELVGIYNGLNPSKPIKQWKGAKKVLIGRIKSLHKDVNGKAPKTVSVVPKAETPQKTAAVKPAGKTQPEVTEKPTRTIRATAIDLLCHVEFHEDRAYKPSFDNVVAETDEQARSVGIAYDEIIRRIQAEFPSCKTTVACLRWYSVKIRVEELGYEGLRLPQRRPRAKARTRS